MELKEKQEESVTFGANYVDAITGFAGIATGFCTYITGCDQVLLAPKVDEKGAWAEPKWFDVSRLVENKDVATLVISLEGQSNGADIPAPVR